MYLKLVAKRVNSCNRESEFIREVDLNISRYLKPELIKLELETNSEFDSENNLSPQKKLWQTKYAVLEELVNLLDQSGKVCNKKKLFVDLFNREKKASTGIGKGIAFPHVRTMQARDFVMGFARSNHGYDFDSLDKLPVHLFFVMVAPPYDDTLYLRVFRSLASLLQYDSLRDELLAAHDEYEIIRAIRRME
jgi:mannitol/fructose-specific phosphotransferase system IIA component (Ntr-type)